MRKATIRAKKLSYTDHKRPFFGLARMIYQDDLEFAALRLYAKALNDRAKESRVPGRLSAADLRDRILASGGRCEWCARNLVGAEFELDHVISLSQRGANSPANLAVACPDCNRRKADKHPGALCGRNL